MDPLLSRKAFYVEGVDSLSALNFGDSLDIESDFANISIINSFKITYAHYDKTPVLEGNHFIHVTFSDVYVCRNNYYLGVLLEQKMEEGSAVNFPDWFIFKVEWCHHQYFLFGKLYHPLGSDGVRNFSYSRDLEDRECMD